MKKLQLIISVIVVFGFKELSAQSLPSPNLLAIPLKTDQDDVLKKINTISVFSNLKDPIPLTGIPESLQHYQLKFFSFNPAQYYYDRYRQGLSSKEEFNRFFKQLKYDSSQVSERFFKHTTYALTGLDTKGQKIIVFDLDQNLDFSNEQIMRFDTAFYSLSKEKQAEKQEKLPIVVFQYEYIDPIGSVKQRKQSLFIDPYRAFFNYPNELDRKLDLMYVYRQWEKGTLQDNGSEYTLFVQNSVALPAPRRGATIKFIFPHLKDKVEPDDYYKLNDTLLIGQQAYNLKGISTFADTLFLEKLVKSERPLGHRVGFYADEVQMTFLDSSKVKLYDLLKKDQYVILDYWGTWCKPCIAKLPAIKKLHEKIALKPNIKMISVAYDDNLNEVKRFVVEQGMDWLQVFESSTNKAAHASSLVKTFRVTLFPTFILIQPDGKIISTDFDEIVAWAESL